MIGTVELVMFGIQGALKLARTGRQIYVENSITRETTFVLPSQLDDIATGAEQYAERLKNSDNDPLRRRFSECFEAAYDRTFPPFSAEERGRATQELVQPYLLDLAEGLVPGSDLHGSSRDIAGMFACRQWSRQDNPFPDPIQRAPGALVEIAVDYFLQSLGSSMNTLPRAKPSRPC